MVSLGRNEAGERFARSPSQTPSRSRSMPDLSSLTDKQNQIYVFIRSKIESRGYGPTIREIGSAFGIRSPNGVMCHLKALQKKGLIDRASKSARAIELIGYKPGRPATLPFYGYVAAGPPI